MLINLLILFKWTLLEKSLRSLLRSLVIKLLIDNIFVEGLGLTHSFADSGTLFHPSKKSLSPHICISFTFQHHMMYIQLCICNSLWTHLCLFEKNHMLFMKNMLINHVLAFICIFGWKIILKMHKNSFCRGELSISPNIKSLNYVPFKSFYVVAWIP